jgi:peptide/nickel transport system substrate-binding protein
VLVALLGTACSGAQGARPAADTAAGQSAASSQPTGPKRVTAAIMSEPGVLSWKLSEGDNLRAGLDTVEPLIIVGMVAADNQGVLRPILAEAVPSTDNGLWKVNADGTMETTWHIRQGAQWHDGTPVTSADFVFTANVVTDPELPAVRDARYRFLDRVEAPDPRTVVARWKQPFVEADAMFGGDLALPLPKHLLGGTYTDAKSSLFELPYWNEQFVGTGPFKVTTFERGSHVLLEANPNYVLGRPKIDQIDVRFILDSNALVANVLSGVVELTLGRSISVEQGLDVRDRWRDGQVPVAPVNFLRLIPQFIDPTPAISSNLDYRRALLYAINRQEMVDTLMYGTTTVAHSFMDPGQASYKAIEDSQVVRYDYDARKAAQTIESLGYAKDASGFYQAADGSGPLTQDVLVSASQEINVKSMYAVADYWQRLGITVNRVVEPTQMSGAQRTVYEATRPGFFLTRQGGDTGNFPRLYSTEVPLQENNYRGSNAARYQSKELDTLLDRYYVTIPLPERTELIGQIIHHISDQLVLLPLFYGAEPIAVGNRIQNMTPRSSKATQAWNATDWDVK